MQQRRGGRIQMVKKVAKKREARKAKRTKRKTKLAKVVQKKMKSGFGKWLLENAGILPGDYEFDV